MKTLLTALLLICHTPVFPRGGGDNKPAITVISVRVTDVHGEAVTGARILVKETAHVLFSDLDGLFTLQLDNAGSVTLYVDVIGFEPKQLSSAQLAGGELILHPLRIN